MCCLVFIANFPKVGQNTHIDREESSKLNITQSIYRTAFKWFNEYEKTDKMGIQRYYIPRSIRYEHSEHLIYSFWFDAANRANYFDLLLHMTFNVYSE